MTFSPCEWGVDHFQFHSGHQAKYEALSTIVSRATNFLMAARAARLLRAGLQPSPALAAAPLARISSDPSIRTGDRYRSALIGRPPHPTASPPIFGPSSAR